MNITAALYKGEPGTILFVHVTPGAKEYSLEYDEWRKEFKIKVKALPRQGKANQDVIAFLGKYFKNPVIISGMTARTKRIRVENPVEETAKILEEILK
ncbi:MAG: YggU family protein [Theionarchaea archaeon]|nr:YggU family protein [Theionarchaea archaeon]